MDTVAQNLSVGVSVFLVKDRSIPSVPPGSHGTIVLATSPGRYHVAFPTEDGVSTSMLILSAEDIMPRNQFLGSIFATIRAAIFKMDQRFGSIYSLSQADIRKELAQAGLFPACAHVCSALLIGRCARERRRISSKEWLGDIKAYYGKV
jgi:hypothetical protein